MLYWAGKAGMDVKIGVIGGGAAGMTAAIAAAGCGAETVILERNDRVGKKLLATGNGRCNLSNLSFSASCYHSEDPVRAFALASRFPPQRTVRFFEGLGVRLKEKDGALYPACGQAGAVLDALRYELDARGVTVRCGETVSRIVPEKAGGFRVETQAGVRRFDRVIVTCGGMAAPKTGSDGSGLRMLEALGLRTVPQVPALVQLRCRGGFFRGLAGIRCDAAVTLQTDGVEAASERGEVQMTDYGISGIPVFQLSRHAAYALRDGKRVTARLDLLPDLPRERVPQWVGARCAQLRRRTAEAFVSGTVHKKWGLFFLKEAGIRPQDAAEATDRAKWEALFLRMKAFPVTVEDTNSFENAQVCAGGVALGEVTDRLEAAAVPGLYLAGEILDVDGRCGGYNLQWAWASGTLAGEACAGKDER